MGELLDGAPSGSHTVGKGLSPLDKALEPCTRHWVGGVPGTHAAESRDVGISMDLREDAGSGAGGVVEVRLGLHNQLRAVADSGHQPFDEAGNAVGVTGGINDDPVWLGSEDERGKGLFLQGVDVAAVDLLRGDLDEVCFAQVQEKWKESFPPFCTEFFGVCRPCPANLAQPLRLHKKAAYNQWAENTSSPRFVQSQDSHEVGAIGLGQHSSKPAQIC